MSKRTGMLLAPAVALLLGASAVFASTEPPDGLDPGAAGGPSPGELGEAEPPVQGLGPVWLLGDGQREFFDDVARAAWLPLEDPTLGLCLSGTGEWFMVEMDWSQLEARSLGRMGPTEIVEIVVHELTGKLVGRLADGTFLPICQPAPEKHLTESRYDTVGFEHLPGVGGANGGWPLNATPTYIDLGGGGSISPAGGGGGDVPDYELPPPVETEDLPQPPPLTPPYEQPPTDLPIWPEEGPTIDPRQPAEDPHAVPEPLTGSMLAAGAFALLAARRRRRKWRNC